MHVFGLTILRCSSRMFFDFSIDFLSLFLSNLYCSLSEVKLFAKIKSVAAYREGPDSRVASASARGVGGHWIESRRGNLLLHP